MSKIPKLTTTDTKEHRPGLLSSQPISRTIANGLSDADKKNILLNHTTPLRNTTAPAQRLDRAATARSSILPSKITKIEKKPLTVSLKIPLYDYKARYHDLLEKHKAIKSKFSDLKDKYDEVSDDYEKIKETAHSSASERDILKEKLLKSNNDLQDKNAEFERMKIDFEMQKLRLNKVQSDFNDLTRSHTSLKEETEVLKLDYKDAQEMIVKYKTDAEALRNILVSMYKEQKDLLEEHYSRFERKHSSIL